jgi:hypothetical protein
VGLERGPFSLARIIEELFQGSSGSGLETEINGRENYFYCGKNILNTKKA